jgi:alpha-L-rhamnosidase
VTGWVRGAMSEERARAIRRPRPGLVDSLSTRAGIRLSAKVAAERQVAALASGGPAEPDRSMKPWPGLPGRRPSIVETMSEPGEPEATTPGIGAPLRLTRRQVLGGGLAGAAGMAAALASGGPGEPDAFALGEAGPSPGPPIDLTVSGSPSPIGLGIEDVFFAWRVADATRGARQHAYRIVVLSRSASPGASVSAGALWDTGRVVSRDQAFIPYGGPPLEPDTPYRWTVQTWSSSDRPGPFASPTLFETGLRDEDWTASWIERPNNPQAEPDQYTYARTETTLPSSAVVRARAYVSGDQQYELYVNGTRTAKGQAYSFPDSQYYETTDVTSLLRPGQANAIGLLYGWQGPTKGHPAGQPGVIAQLNVHFADGRSQVIGTDGSWRVLKGAWLPGTQRDLEGDLVDFTENIDGPAIPLGWESPGFDDHAWQPAVVLGPAGTAPFSHLVPVRTRIVEEPIRPVSVNRLGSGSFVADFGKVYAAVPTVRFRHGVPGRLIKMRAGYLLDEPGQSVTGEPGQVSAVHGTQHTDMSYSYVQRGGHEEFHSFDYLGFRYFQVDDPGEELRAEDLVALARHSDGPHEHAATFRCSNPTVDAVFDLCRHSALFTAQEQYLDTPTREKGPWLWDGFNESKTAIASLADQNLTRKSLTEFAQSQARYWPNGAVNKIYPTGLGALDINEFTEIYPEWVWQYWLHTADRPLLESVYPTLVALAGYVDASIVPSTGLVTNLPATNVYYSFPVVTRLNVLGVNVFRRVGDVAKALRRPTEEVGLQRQRQQTLASAVRSSLTRPDGIYADGIDMKGAQVQTASQDTNACAAVYGVAPRRRLGAIGAYVASLDMTAPPRTASEVLRTLALASRFDDLVTRLTDPTSNGWANILARGGTFTWEVWQPSDAKGDSMSHGWGSDALVVIQQSLLGVTPIEPGFETFRISPPGAGLAWAEGTVPTPRGTIEVRWRRGDDSGDASTLDVVVPANSTAVVEMATSRPDRLTEGARPVDRSSGARILSTTDRLVSLKLGAGTYSFHART